MKKKKKEIEKNRECTDIKLKMEKQNRMIKKKTRKKRKK